MRCLVTGASGFIGQNLCKYLSDQGYQITTLGRTKLNGDHIYTKSYDHENISSSILGKKYDVLFHLTAAGVNPKDRISSNLEEINIKLPAKLVNLCANQGIKTFIMSGSSAEYSTHITTKPKTETDPLNRNDLYGKTKAIGGLKALKAGKKRNITTLVLRLFNVYGPGESAHRLLPSLLRGIKRDEKIKMSQGTQIRDFIHVLDVCRAMEIASIKSLSNQISSGAYNICTGIGNSVASFANIVCQQSKVPVSILNIGAIPLRPNEPNNLVGTARKFTQATGWRPNINLERGINLEINFHKRKMYE